MDLPNEKVQCNFLHKPEESLIQTQAEIPSPQYSQAASVVPGPYAYPSLQEHYEGPTSWQGEWQDSMVLLRKKAASIEFDVIYCHDWPLLPLALELKQTYKKPLVFHVHSLEYDRSRQPSEWLSRLERKGLDVADKIIVGSQYHAEIVRKYYFIYPGKIEVIYPGADHIPALPKLKPEYPLVVFMGRLSEQKGIMDFMRACELVFSSLELARVAIAGEGELEHEVSRHIRLSPNRDRFTQLGFLEHEEKIALLRSATLFCAPSLSEPFGLSAIEAARLGVPSVLSDRCGALEIIGSALHTPPGDQSGVAFSLLTLLNNPQLQKTMSEQIQQEASTLTWDKTKQAIVRILQDA
jgi:hypothetical protein